VRNEISPNQFSDFRRCDFLSSDFRDLNLKSRRRVDLTKAATRPTAGWPAVRNVRFKTDVMYLTKIVLRHARKTPQNVRPLC
jgi:hypothetical protein